MARASAFPTLQLEQTLQLHGHRLIAGVDEVGRGSWAGPIVSAAVVLPLDTPTALESLHGVRDSKLLTRQHRVQLAGLVQQVALASAVGWCGHATIDRLGIAGANRQAMQRAIAKLPLLPEALLLDHVRLPGSPLPQLSIAHGDALSLSIAAASIVAKVFRDRWMERYGRQFPPYGFERNSGYGTAEHRSALLGYGPCPIHRRSFRPINEIPA